MASFGSSLKARMADALRRSSMPLMGTRKDDITSEPTTVTTSSSSVSAKKTKNTGSNKGNPTNNDPIDGVSILPKKKKGTDPDDSAATSTSTPNKADASTNKPKKSSKDKGATDVISSSELEKPSTGDGNHNSGTEKVKAGKGGGKKKQKRASTEPILTPAEGDTGGRVDNGNEQKIAKKESNKKKNKKMTQEEIAPKALSSTGPTCEEANVSEEQGEQQRPPSPKKKTNKQKEAKRGTNKKSKTIDDTHQAGSSAIPTVTESPMKGSKGKKATIGDPQTKKATGTVPFTNFYSDHPPLEKDGDGMVEFHPPLRMKDGDESAASPMMQVLSSTKADKAKPRGTDDFAGSEPLSDLRVRTSKRSEEVDHGELQEQSTKPEKETIDEEITTNEAQSEDPIGANLNHVENVEVQTNESTYVKVGISSPLKKKKETVDDDGINAGVKDAMVAPSSPNKAGGKVRKATLPEEGRKDPLMDLGGSPGPSSPLKSPKAKGRDTLRNSSQSPRKKSKAKLPESNTSVEEILSEANVATIGTLSICALDPVLVISENNNSDDINAAVEDSIMDTDSNPSTSPQESSGDDEKATMKGNETAQHLEQVEDLVDDESPVKTMLETSLSSRQGASEQVCIEVSPTIEAAQPPEGEEEHHIDDEFSTMAIMESSPPIAGVSKQVHHDEDLLVADLDSTEDIGNPETAYLDIKLEKDDGGESNSQPADLDNGKPLSSSKKDCGNATSALETATRGIENENSDAAHDTVDENEGSIPVISSDSLVDSKPGNDAELMTKSLPKVLESVSHSNVSIRPVAIFSSNLGKNLEKEKRSAISPSVPSNDDAMSNQPTHDICRNKIDAAISMLRDKSKKEKVEEMIVRIQVSEGFPIVRPLSTSDNDIVRTLTNSICDDPSIIEIKIDSDVRFEHVARSLVIGFGEGMRSNMHLQSLTMTGLGLGDYFLFALATTMEINFVLTSINLSNNQFTNEGLAHFCQALGMNGSCQVIDLTKQQSKIVESSHDGIFDALQLNRSLLDLKVDFQSERGDVELATILKRNTEQQGAIAKDPDEKLVEFLRNEAEQSEFIAQLRKAGQEMGPISDDDWLYLSELSNLHEKYKAQDNSRDNTESAFEAATDNMTGWTSDGSFLTSDFISEYLKEGQNTLTFDFCGQCSLFKRFSATDPARKTIVRKFVAALLDHPRSNDITGINMANSCMGSDFFVELSSRCRGGNSILRKVRSINAETNYLTEPGIVALAKCISDRCTLPSLQIVKLANQKTLISSRGELALARAMCVNRSVIVLSVQVRSLLERQQINNYVVRNIDCLRQARRRKAIETGCLTGRKRNEMEVYFDKIASNDPSVTVVELVGNHKFKGLSDDEKVKAATAFATNSQVKVVNMSNLGLDDRFAQALGDALASNCTIEKIALDSNSFSGEGMKALFSGLAKNSSVTELQVRHQSKKLASADEDLLADMLEPNNSVIKVGIDIRSQMAKMKVDRKMAQNSEYQRKRRSRP